MFSLSEIDHIAWMLLCMIGAWVVVNALVDLSGDGRQFSDPLDDEAPTDSERSELDRAHR